MHRRSPNGLFAGRMVASRAFLTVTCIRSCVERAAAPHLDPRESLMAHRAVLRHLLLALALVTGLLVLTPGTAQAVGTGSLTGTVRDADGPLADVVVSAYKFEDDAWSWAAEASSGVTGAYEVVELEPGSYFLQFEDYTGDHALVYSTGDENPPSRRTPRAPSRSPPPRCRSPPSRCRPAPTPSSKVWCTPQRAPRSTTCWWRRSGSTPHQAVTRSPATSPTAAATTCG